MIQPPLILSVGVADARLSDPDWAGEMVGLADSARIDLLLLGDSGLAPFDPLAVAHWLAPHAGMVGLVPMLDTCRDLPVAVARALSELDLMVQAGIGWQPTTLAQSPTGDSVSQGIDFVAATRNLWDSRDENALIMDNDHRDDSLRGVSARNADRPLRERPVLIQSDADPLWEHVAADIVIIDMDSPKPAHGPKVLLRTFTALAGIDQIDQLYSEGIIDGIHLTPPFPRRGLQEFAETMLPVLIERGLIPPARPSGTLRQRLGLPAEPHSLKAELAG